MFSSMEEEEREENRGGRELWSWGAGTDGQLCTSKLQDELLPQPLPSLSFPTNPISQLACGGAHVIALTRDHGRVLTWGRGTSGQLGHGDIVNSLYPKPVKTLESFVISHVAAGWNHSGFASDSGRVFTCGDGSFGQLGHGDFKSQSLPLEILYFVSKHVGKIACGMRHSLALLKGNSGDPIYGFGSAKRGQLGVTKDRIKKLFNLPQVVFGFEDAEVDTIIANGDQSAALTVDGSLYTWGKGFYSSSDAYVPSRLQSSLMFKQVALGWNHALLLTDKGEVFMLGGNHHGLLSDPQKTSLECQGSDDDRKALSLGKVPGLMGMKVMHIAAGAEHSALITVDGKIMTWGWGEHGQLGLGDVCDRTSPQILILGDRFLNNCLQYRVCCGSGFTFAIGMSC